MAYKISEIHHSELVGLNLKALPGGRESHFHAAIENHIQFHVPGILTRARDALLVLMGKAIALLPEGSK
jgi:hypothetical protein